MLDRTQLAARARWLAAEDRLYPALVTDAGAYERALTQIHAVVEQLRARCQDLPGLVAAEAAAADVIASACPDGSAMPADLLIQVACAMRSREIAVQPAEPAQPAQPAQSAQPAPPA
jgi:hypothetical protein